MIKGLNLAQILPAHHHASNREIGSQTAQHGPALSHDHVGNKLSQSLRQILNQPGGGGGDGAVSLIAHGPRKGNAGHAPAKGVKLPTGAPLSQGTNGPSVPVKIPGITG